MNKPLKITGLLLLTPCFILIAVAVGIGYAGFAVYKWGDAK